MKNKKNEENIEELLSQLDSGEGKAFVVSKLVGKGIDVPKKDLIGAIPYLEKNGDFYRVAEVCEKAGLIKKAIDAYNKWGIPEKGVELARDSGWPKNKLESLCERAVEYYTKKDLSRGSGVVESDLIRELAKPSTLIDFYEANKSYGKAAEIAEKEGLFEKAVELYLKEREIESYWKVGNIAKRRGLLAQKAGQKRKAKRFFEKAIKYYKEIYSYGEAARISKEIGLNEQATLLYNKAIERALHPDYFASSRNPNYSKAANLAIESGSPKKAIEIYLNHNKPLEAMDVAIEAGLMDEVQKIYTQEIERHETCRGPDFMTGNDFEEMGVIAQKVGFIKQAKEYYNEAIEHFEAEKLYDRAIDVAKKAELGDKVKELLNRSVEFYESCEEGYPSWIARRDHLIKAASLSEEAENLDKAIELYENAGRYDRIVDLVERTGWKTPKLKLYKTLKELLKS